MKTAAWKSHDLLLGSGFTYRVFFNSDDPGPNPTDHVLELKSPISNRMTYPSGKPTKKQWKDPPFLNG